MIKRRSILAAIAAALTPGAGRALRVEQAPDHIVAAHGSALAAQRRHAVLIAAARTALIDEGRTEDEAERLLAAYRCPDCGSHMQ